MLDAIIISDTGNDTFSGSSPLRLKIDGKIALIQNVKNFLANNGKIVSPVMGENKNNWHCAYKLNGIRLYDHLQKAGFKVDLIDSYYRERDDFIKMLSDNPKAVIISTTFIIDKNSLYELVNDIRSLAADIYIIAGGPFVLSSYLLLQKTGEKNYDTDSPKDDYLFLNHQQAPDIDLYIIDKGGEQILSESLHSIINGRQVKDLPNTARLENGRYVFSGRKEQDPFHIGIEWEAMPEKIFSAGIVNVQASIGCPFNCEFCNFVKDKKHTHVKPLNQLVKELKTLNAKGIKYIRFADDNFRLGRNDLNEVSERFIREELDIKWMSFVRAGTLEKTDRVLLKQAGCVEAQMGIESADKTVLDKMNKHSEPRMYETVIKNLLDAGINCSCCFIAGFPGETEKTINNTVNFIDNIADDIQPGIFYWSMYPFLLAPLSPIYEPRKREQYKLRGYKNKWEHYTMNSEQAYRYINKAFLEIESSSPIYSGDNIDMLMDLSSRKRKEFMNVRHALSKKFIKQPFDASLVLSSFSKVFNA